LDKAKKRDRLFKKVHTDLRKETILWDECLHFLGKADMPVLEFLQIV